MFLSPEGLIYICDRDNHCVTVHDEEGMFLFAFGSKGSDPRCFDGPHDVTFGSEGLVYVTDVAATGDNYLLITSYSTDTVMVYTLGGQLVHEFGGSSSDLGKFRGPYGICVDSSGAVYVADYGNRRVQVF